MIGGKGRVVWNATCQWWEYEEPRVDFGTDRIVWARLLILLPVERVPLTPAQLLERYSR